MRGNVEENWRKTGKTKKNEREIDSSKRGKFGIVLVKLSQKLQTDQINMVVFFRYPVKSDLFNVRYCTRVHWT